MMQAKYCFSISKEQKLGFVKLIIYTYLKKQLKIKMLFIFKPSLVNQLFLEIINC